MSSLLTREAYTYKPLDPTKREIRLMTLLPNTSLAAPVSITLSNVSLQDSPNYEAVSYVWGDPSIKASMILDGTSIEVTTNLEIALRHFRLDSEVRILWADAVCINQQDNLEKSSQVAMMGDIYRSCAKCLAWLGEDNDGDGYKTFRMMNELGAGNDVQFPACKDSTEHPLSELTHLYNIMNAPYWSRIWVVQETVLPRRVEYWCGKSTIDRDIWTKVRKPLHIIRAIHGAAYCDSCCAGIRAFLAEAAGIFANALRGKSSGTYMPLDGIWVLYHTVHLLSQKPIDKVYAVLALASPRYRSRFVVDYQATTLNRLSADVLAADIMEGGGLRMLGMFDQLGIGGETNYASWWPFPHWHPELAVKYGNDPINSHRLSLQRIFSACGSAGILTDFNSVEAGCLGVSSILIDYVDTAVAFKALYPKVFNVTSSKRPKPQLGLYAAGEQEFIRGSHQDTDEVLRIGEDSRLTPYIGGGTISNAWWRTLVSDSFFDEDSREFKRVTESEKQTFHNIWTIFTTRPSYEWRPHFQKNPETQLHHFFKTLAIIDSRSSITTGRQYIGTAPMISRSGDEVHIVAGSNWPLLLRKVSDATAGVSATYRCLGQCYIHGIMDGEAAANFEDRATMIRLV